MTIGLPLAQGLYDPRNEHDSCGVGFIVDLKGRKSHQLVRDGLTALHNLNHRGACGCENNTGDGAGLLIQLPHEFLAARCRPLGIDLPEPEHYGVGAFFTSPEESQQQYGMEHFERIVAEEGQVLLGWRRIQTDASSLGESARRVEPVIWHAMIGRGQAMRDADRFERKLYVIRKRFEKEIEDLGLDDHKFFYFSSLSCRTLVYKGMLTTEQLGLYFADDLGDPLCSSALCMFHSRFSTNTFPSWELAHPYRMISHNGEINTLRGNINWMKAREALFASDLYEPGDIAKLKPIIREGLSDTACLDNAVELLVRSGYTLPHAMMMLIPEAWENHESMSRAKKDFYRYHSCLMEPWDGPASVTFTDGKMIGAVLDRNGLRPSRYVETEDGRVIMASEVGALEIDPATIVRKGRLEPGKMFLVDLEKGQIVDDDELKNMLASAHPYGEWLDKYMVPLADLPAAPEVPGPDPETLLHRQMAFGYTLEDLKYILGPMGSRGEEAIGSMGTDTPLAVLSDRAQPLFNYFKQLFAQVTNPPLDAIREELVTSVFTGAGGERNLLVPEPESCRQIALAMPILDNDELARIKQLDHWRGFTTLTLPMLFEAAEGAVGLEAALAALIDQACTAIEDGANLIVLSDRGVSDLRAAIPSLLACSGLHHEMVRRGLRARAGLIIECGDAREVHHFALLLGYGAGTVNPYLAFETLDDMIRQGTITEIDRDEAVYRFGKAIKKGVVKVMSKMGHQQHSELSGRPDIRGDRAPRRFRPEVLRQDRLPHRRHRPRGNRPRDAHSSPSCVLQPRIAVGLASGGWPVSVATRRRTAPLQPRDRVSAPACHAGGPVRPLQELYALRRRPERAALHAPRLVRISVRQEHARADRRGRAGRLDRSTVRDRRDELWLDLGRGSRNPGDRDEPDRRQIEYRRRG